MTGSAVAVAVRIAIRAGLTVMAARLHWTLRLCRAVVVAMVIRVATPSGDRQHLTDLDPESTFIFDIGAGRRRLPVAMSSAGNVRRLPNDVMFHKLGHHFDPRHMAVDKPAILTATSGSGVNGSRDDAELVRDLRRLRFTYVDERGVERRLSAAVVVDVQRWLLELSRCEVVYSWQDMGDLFWPRWVRHGRCDSLAVCSWPPGMYCAPAPSEVVRLLHWQCRRRPTTAERRRVIRRHRSSDESSSSLRLPRPGNRQARRHRPACRWKRVPYPVITECFCSC